jgi:hypothetical protein
MQGSFDDKEWKGCMEGGGNDGEANGDDYDLHAKDKIGRTKG